MKRRLACPFGVGVRSSARFPLALGLAAALHAAVWASHAARSGSPAAAAVEAARDDGVEVELDEAAEVAAHAETKLAALDSKGDVSARAAGQGALRVKGVDAQPDTSGPESAAAAPPSSSGPVTSVWNMDALAQRDLGVGDARTVPVPPPVSEREMVRDRIRRSLQDGLRDQEVAAGGDPTSGPVMRALRDATDEGLGPVNGTATFDAVISAAGVIVSVGVVDASSSRGDWDRIARESLRSLAGKTLRTSSGGVVVRLQITSREQLPSGAAPGHAVDVSGPSVDPRFSADETHATGAGNVLHGSFDLSDIGATSRRVISAHVVTIRDL